MTRMADMDPATPKIHEMVSRHSPDGIKHAIREELRPIVRDALTEETLRSVQKLIGLTPRAVSLIEADLESEDPVIRQRAYTLLLKYTVGHPAVVRPDDTDGSKQIVVNFALPRPEVLKVDAEAELEPSEELKVCDMCGEEKPESKFVSGSDRCRACYDRWRSTIMDQFG